MKRFLCLAVMCTLPFLWCNPAVAQETRECVELVTKAIEMFESKGRDATLKAIDDKKGPFVKGNIYVFALTMENVILAHPFDKTLKTINCNEILDGNGKFFFKEFAAAAANGGGWVDYTFAKPGQKDASTKRSYVKKVPADNIYFGAGYYSDSRADR